MRHFRHESEWLEARVGWAEGSAKARARVLKKTCEIYSRAGVLFLLPAMRSVDARTLQSVTRTIELVRRNGLEADLAVTSDLYLPDARELLAETAALQSTFRHVLWVDSDMEIDPLGTVGWILSCVTYADRGENHASIALEQDLGPADRLEMEERARELLFGCHVLPYMTRTGGLSIYPMATGRRRETPPWLGAIETCSTVRVAAAGMGLMLCPTALLALMPSPLFERRYVRTRNAYESEDISFCARVNDEGGQIIASFRFPAPAHHVVLPLTLDEYVLRTKRDQQSRLLRKEAFGDTGPRDVHLEEEGLRVPDPAREHTAPRGLPPQGVAPPIDVSGRPAEAPLEADAPRPAADPIGGEE